MKKKISSSSAAFIASIIILIGCGFLFYNYITSQKIKAYDYMSKAFYNEKEEVVENLELEVKVEKEEVVEELPEEISNEYIGYLNIPRINLTKGFLDYRSENNNVDTNLMVVYGSSYPSKRKTNFVVAGHSGTAWNSFFNELYQLQLGDNAIVDYKNKKYHYNLVNIYTQPKIGKIAIYRDAKKSTMTLITCTNNTDETQTVYIWELDHVEE